MDSDRAVAGSTLTADDVAALTALAFETLKQVPLEANEEHCVAAVVMSQDRKLFSGINFSHFTGGPCGEPVAIANAAAKGRTGDKLIGCVAVVRRQVREPANDPSKLP
jgi:cytidine deaminase